MTAPAAEIDTTRPIGSLAGIKVMVIDDSNTIRRSAEIFLVQAGCQVILADDGFDALAKISDHQPNVIFCDIVMPRLDGYQTCALIKRSQRFARTPVIMLSSKDGLFDRARGRMVGSDEYLTKPFTKDSLLKTVGVHAGVMTAATAAVPNATGSDATASDAMGPDSMGPTPPTRSTLPPPAPAAAPRAIPTTDALVAASGDMDFTRLGHADS